MATNPFDPPLVQMKRALTRGGLSGANQGFGSVRMPPAKARSAPGISYLMQLRDVSGTAPEHGDILVFDSTIGPMGTWVPGPPSGVPDYSEFVDSVLAAETAEEILTLLGFEDAVNTLIGVLLDAHAALNPADGVHGITADSTEPGSPEVGDVWIDTT